MPREIKATGNQASRAVLWCLLQVILEQEAKVTHFKVELQKAQDMHTATVNKDMEKQQNYLDKMRAEVR